MKADTEGLRVDDLNSIIKYFASQINNRIQQLENLYRPDSLHRGRSIYSTMDAHQLAPSLEFSSQDGDVDQLLTKYASFNIKNDLDLEYTRKFIHRIQQIFGFYKWRSKNQSILSHAERQITNKLNILLTSSKEPNLGKILSYVVGVTRKGFINKSVNFPKERDNRQHSAVKIKTPTTSVGSKYNSNAENDRVLSRFGTKELAVWAPEMNSENVSLRKKRAVSVMSSYGSTPLAKQAQSSFAVVVSLYSCLDIDKNHLQKCIESEGYCQRDLIKRNKSVLKKIRDKQLQSANNSYRKMKTEFTYDLYDRKALGELNNRSKMVDCFQMQQKHEAKKAPVMNLGVLGHKRRKIKTSQKRRNYESHVVNNQNFA